MSGIGAAISAARQGLQVALIQNRPVLGDHILSEQDVRQGIVYDDGCVVATWGIDLHYPLTTSECEPACESFRSGYSKTGHASYPIPYRCLYSRNIGNLFMAGRCISVTHVALGTIRVMRTCGMMGEVIGKAAYVCHTYEISPRQVYEERLDELFVALGGAPVTMDLIVDDTAAERTGAWSSSTHDAGYYAVGYLHDGNAGKGTKSVRFPLVVTEDGAYEVFLRWTASANRASNVPVIIVSDGGIDTTSVNMQEHGSQWVSQGEYTFSAADTGAVTIATDGTDGYVVADAVALRRVEPPVATESVVVPRHPATTRVHAGGTTFDLAVPPIPNASRARLLVLDLHGRVYASYEVNLSVAQQDLYCDALSGTAHGIRVLTVIEQSGTTVAARAVVVRR